MSVEIPDDRPLNLRDLAQEDSPDVVRVALRRFRRRTVIRGAWVAALALGALLITPLLPDDRDVTLAERYYGLPGVSLGRSATAGAITVTVIDARRLDRDTGAIHFLAADSEGSELLITDVFKGTTESGGGGQLQETLSGSIGEAFATVALPFTDDVITVALVSVGTDGTPGPTRNISVDLSDVRELHDLWR